MKKGLVEVCMENIRLRAIIGIHDWERKEKQDVIISIRYKYNASAAIKTDDINHALDYKPLCKKIIKAVLGSKFNLVESLAAMVYEIVKQNALVTDVIVEVKKPFALRFADSVSVRIYD